MPGIAGWYEHAAISYLENKPTSAYVDVLARQVIAGDSGRLMELCLVLGGIAEFASAKYIRAARVRGVERDDLRQSAMCMMLKGLRTWNPQKGSFKAYAGTLAHFGAKEVLNASLAISTPQSLVRAGLSERGSEVRSRYRRATVASAERALKAPSTLSPVGPEETPVLNAGSEESGYEEALTSLSLEQMLRYAGITPEERRALDAKYGSVGTQIQGMKRLADELGISWHVVHHSARGALRKLQMKNSPQVDKAS